MERTPEAPTAEDVTGVEVGIVELEDTGFEGIEKETTRHLPVIEVVDPYPENGYPVGLLADMRINVRCPEGCDLGGGVVLIGDENNLVVSEQLLTSFTDRERQNTTGTFKVRIPEEPGFHTWTIVYFPAASVSENIEDIIPEEIQQSVIPLDSSLITEEAFDSLKESSNSLHAIVQADFVFEAVPHVSGISIWRDSLAPVPTGSNYLLNIGVACTQGCSLLQQKVKVYHENALVATAEMNTAIAYKDGAYVPIAEIEEPVAPKDILYWTQISLTAPNEVCAFSLECRPELEGLDLSHKTNTRKYTITTRKHSQCRLDLMAVSDKSFFSDSSNNPIKHADIIVRPKDGYAIYLRTDKSGKASVGVPWGDICIEANEDDHKNIKLEITVPEGQEVYEHTVHMPYWPSLMA
jgi:hypothetical protein